MNRPWFVRVALCGAILVPSASGCGSSTPAGSLTPTEVLKREPPLKKDSAEFKALMEKTARKRH